MPPSDVRHAFYRLYAYVVSDDLADGWNRDRIISSIAAEGVQVQYGSCAEVYREEAVVQAGLAPPEPLPVATELHATSLAFLVHPTLSAADIADVVEAVRKVMEVASGEHR
jgi:dTDP-4-amino-4,6-dideoxygalactose transaminase